MQLARRPALPHETPDLSADIDTQSSGAIARFSLSQSFSFVPARSDRFHRWLTYHKKIQDPAKNQLYYSRRHTLLTDLEVRLLVTWIGNSCGRT